MLLATAPTGNVGAEVARLLVNQNHIPYRLAAHNPDKLNHLGDDIPVIAFSYDKPAGWDVVLDGIEVVFLVFPLPSPRRVNRWMKPFIDKLVQCEIKHIIYLDVPGSGEKHVLPHYAVERYIEASGIPYTFLRATYFMQNFCRAISTHGVDIVEHGELFIPAGNKCMTPVDARDVAQVVLKIAEQPTPHQNQVYALVGPETMNLHQMAEILSEVLGQPIRYTNPNFLRFWWRMFRRGVKWDVIGFMTLLYRFAESDDTSQSENDLTDLLSRQPTDLRQFVTEERWRWETQTWT